MRSSSMGCNGAIASVLGLHSAVWSLSPPEQAQHNHAGAGMRAKAQQILMACRQAVPQLLKKLQLAHGQVTVESTPRRLAVMVARVQAKQEDVEESVRGPPAKVRSVVIVVAQGKASTQRMDPSAGPAGPSVPLDEAAWRLLSQATHVAVPASPGGVWGGWRADQSSDGLCVQEWCGP